MLDIIELLVYIVITFCIAEILLWLAVRFTNKRFQWLITKKDSIPNLSKDGLNKFIPIGYEPELGWVRKPNTSHTERGRYGFTEWHINAKGARFNPKYEDSKSTVSCYGDSFTFSRQVNDNETWEHYLSELLNTNVLNFGVGNYGVDQTLLRLKREYPQNKTQIVIIGVVPDTISRIMSIWKHYYEYGNTFGFKPRFVIKNGKLMLIKNPIDTSNKFFEFQKFLPYIRKNDFFYKNKFQKELLRFPFLFYVLKNPTRNLKLIFWILIIQLLKYFHKDVSKIEWNPMKIIMRINLQWRVKLYNNPESIFLFKKIIEEFVKYSRENNFKAVFIFLPQKDDLIFIKSHFHYYKKFLNELDEVEGLYNVDITSNLIKLDDNEYGGHLSSKGNQQVASLIYEKLLDFNLIR